MAGQPKSSGVQTNLRVRERHSEPLTFPPFSQPHTQTFILLHGRGSNGAFFGRALLDHPISTYQNLRHTFPRAKFVFPTASFRRAKVYKRTAIAQWFDAWHLTESMKQEELQVEGLVESSNYLHGLIRDAITEWEPGTWSSVV